MIVSFNLASIPETTADEDVFLFCPSRHYSLENNGLNSMVVSLDISKIQRVVYYPEDIDDPYTHTSLKMVTL